MYIVVRGAGVKVVNEAVSSVAAFLPGTAEVCFPVTATTDCVVGIAGCCTGTDGCVASARKV